MPTGVYKRTKEHKANLSAARKGVSYEEMYGDKAEEQRAKRSHPVTEQALVNMRAAQNRPEVNARRSIALTGITRSKETRAKMGASKRGDNNPMKNPEHRAKQKEATNKAEVRERRIKSVLRANRIKPNKGEKRLYDLLQRLLFGEYQINVKAEVMILGGKCPDFVNVNGQKKIIEFNGDYWHGEERTGVPNEQHEQERIDYFARFGYQTLIVWEHELDDIEGLTNRILKFNGVR